MVVVLGEEEEKNTINRAAFIIFIHFIVISCWVRTNSIFLRLLTTTLRNQELDLIELASPSQFRAFIEVVQCLWDS